MDTILKLWISSRGAQADPKNGMSANQLSAIVLLAIEGMSVSKSEPFHATDPVGDTLTALWELSPYIAAETLDAILDKFGPDISEEDVLTGIRRSIKTQEVATELLDYWDENFGDN